jgi:predicted metallo-beta-lactamase superfamily hydrolase
VRSLATFVTTASARVLIDPGVSVCPERDGLHPHPLELAALRETRQRIQERAVRADSIVITHFHHDHYTSFERRELDLTDAETARALYRDTPVYTKAWQRHLNRAQRTRAIAFARDLGRRVTVADGLTFGKLKFSPPAKHGEEGSQQGWVTMLSIEDGGERLVFASDIQLIEAEAIDWIIDEHPGVVIASGPPIYLGILPEAALERARQNLVRLCEATPTAIIDHHLTRTTAYREFIAEAVTRADLSGHRLLTAAEYMGVPDNLLEAHRQELWAETPENGQP